MRERFLFGSVVALVLATACGDGGTSPTDPGGGGSTTDPVATAIALDPPSLTIRDGESHAITVSVKDQNGATMAGQSPSWSSSDPEVAEVEGGTITAVHPGTASVTAKVGAAEASVEVTVVPVPTRVQQVGGNEQVGLVGSALADSLAVRIVDRHGNGVPGVAVPFVVTSGSGSISPQSALTDGEGYARAEWILGDTAGTETAEARPADVEGAPVEFSATATADANTPRLVKDSGDKQVGSPGAGLSERLAVKLTDLSGNPLRTAEITWAVTSGAGAVAPGRAVTNSTGIATAVWTLGEDLGEQTVRAEHQGLSVSFTATATAGPVASVSVEPDSVRLTFVGDTAQLIATAKDAGGNSSEAKITWTSLDDQVATVAAGGVVTAVADGATRVVATVGALADTATVVVERVVASVRVTPATSRLSAGESATLAATAFDSDGVEISTSDFTWASSNTATATVDSNGLVLAVGPGSAEIGASTEGRTGTAVVTVTITEPESFVVSDTVYGAIDPVGDEDVFTFDGVAEQEINVFFQTLSGSYSNSLSLQVYRHYGTLDAVEVGNSAYSSGNNDTLIEQSTGAMTLPETGTYSVVVSGGRDDAGPYRFSVYPVDAAPETLGSRIVAGDTISGEAISLPGDKDVFTFEGVAGQEINVFLQTLSGSASNGLYLQVYRDYGTLDAVEVGNSAYSSGNNSSLGGQSTGVMTLPETGTYSVVVWGGDRKSRNTYNSGPYRFSVYPVDAAPETLGSRIAVGDTLSGEAISLPGDKDVFTFEGVAGQEINVFLQTLSGSASNGLYLQVYRDYGTLEAVEVGNSAYSSGSNSSLGGQSTGVMTLPETGTYSVVVWGGDRKSRNTYNSGPYRFSVYPVDAAPETLGSRIAVGDTISGETISLPGDKDVFTFEGVAGQEINVFLQTLSGSASNGLYLQVYREHGTPQAAEVGNRAHSSGNNGALSGQSTGVMTLPETGAYSVVIWGGDRKSRNTYNSGPYRFSVYPVDAAPETLGSHIVVGDTISGEAISLPGDKDVFTFEGVAGQEINVFLQTLSGSYGNILSLQVYRAYGTPQAAEVGNRAHSSGNNVALSGQSTGVMTLPETGTYSVVIWGGDRKSTNTNNGGPYRFSVQRVSGES